MGVCVGLLTGVVGGVVETGRFEGFGRGVRVCDPGARSV